MLNQETANELFLRTVNRMKEKRPADNELVALLQKAAVDAAVFTIMEYEKMQEENQNS